MSLRQIGEDRWQLVVERPPVDGVVRTSTIEWSRRPTEAELAIAMEDFPDEGEPMRPGDHLTARKLGPITVWSEVGPPPWRFPRLIVRPLHAEVGVGWRFTAYRVTWRWPWARR